GFTWRGETSQATLTFEPKRGLGVDNTTPVAMLEWEDSAGDHRSDDLIANPPVVA
ncbi:sucrose phosphorylase domain-containing protein, partial [Bifidobacterium adolescentis]